MAQPNLFAGTAFDGDCFAGYGSGYGWWDAYTGAPANGSANSITITNTTGASDVVSWLCFGY
jgi:hypothetical protein